jgi:hypothetical protein
LAALGVIDDVIPEPLGGAHRDHHLMANRLKIYLRTKLRELTAVPTDRLLEERYAKFRRIGVFLEGPAAMAASAASTTTTDSTTTSATTSPDASPDETSCDPGPVARESEQPLNPV